MRAGCDTKEEYIRAFDTLLFPIHRRIPQGGNVSDVVTTELPTHHAIAGQEPQADVFTLLNSESVRRDPYPLYAQYRADQRVLDTGIGIWFLFGYEDCNRVLRGQEFSVDERHALIPGPGDELPTLIHLDSPNHDRLRRLVQAAFTPKRVEALRVRAHELACAQLDQWSPGDEVDIISELAYPVPLTIICELLGI